MCSYLFKMVSVSRSIPAKNFISPPADDSTILVSFSAVQHAKSRVSIKRDKRKVRGLWQYFKLCQIEDKRKVLLVQTEN